jgi:hypothetical protein
VAGRATSPLVGLLAGLLLGCPGGGGDGAPAVELRLRREAGRAQERRITLREARRCEGIGDSEALLEATVREETNQAAPATGVALDRSLTALKVTLREAPAAAPPRERIADAAVTPAADDWEGRRLYEELGLGALGHYALLVVGPRGEVLSCASEGLPLRALELLRGEELPPLPERAVAPGDTWTGRVRTRVPASGGLVREVDLTCTLAAIEARGGARVAVIALAGELVPFPREEQELRGRVEDGPVSGRWELDLDTGRELSRRLELSFSRLGGEKPIEVRWAYEEQVASVPE